MRWNPLTRWWIIVAGHRGQRPWRPQGCPFCPGSPELPPTGWRVAVLPNRYPALSPDAPEVRSHSEVLRVRRAVGCCEVVVETPQHEGDLCDLDLDQVTEYLKVLRSECERLGKLPYVRYVAVFRNKGAEVGVSLTHPHSQIYALPFTPPRIRTELLSFRRYWVRRRDCLLCAVLREELSVGERVVYVNKYFVTLLPYYAMWPYEVHVYPRDHVQYLTQLSDEVLRYLADVLRIVTATYRVLLRRDPPYIMVLHQAPVKRRYPYYHLHLEFYQPYRDPEKLKYAAGIEWGFWVFTYDGVPEVKAQELRRCCREVVKSMDHLGEVV